eukprot:4897587-Prymnesium_polylepis.1
MFSLFFPTHLPLAGRFNVAAQGGEWVRPASQRQPAAGRRDPACGAQLGVSVSLVSLAHEPNPNRRVFRHRRRNRQGGTGGRTQPSLARLGAPNPKSPFERGRVTGGYNAARPAYSTS